MTDDLLQGLAYPVFTPTKPSDEINDQDVADAFWFAFENSSSGQTESTWKGLRAALRVIADKRALGVSRK
jgi:hypothetical protein